MIRSEVYVSPFRFLVHYGRVDVAGMYAAFNTLRKHRIAESRRLLC